MKRITISLPDDVEAGLRRDARRRGVAISAIVRERIETSARAGDGRRIPFAAIGRSGTRDTARRMDEILAEEWNAPRDRAGAGGR